MSMWPCIFNMHGHIDLFYMAWPFTNMLYYHYYCTYFQIFFRPNKIMDMKTDGIDGYARGLCAMKSQTVDRYITKEVTSKLFSEHPPHGLGTDLVSLNIQRGRDHGVPGQSTCFSLFPLKNV